MARTSKAQRQLISARRSAARVRAEQRAGGGMAAAGGAVAGAAYGWLTTATNNEGRPYVPRRLMADEKDPKKGGIATASALALGGVAVAIVARPKGAFTQGMIAGFAAIAAAEMAADSATDRNNEKKENK